IESSHSYVRKKLLFFGQRRHHPDARFFTGFGRHLGSVTIWISVAVSIPIRVSISPTHHGGGGTASADHYAVDFYIERQFVIRLVKRYAQPVQGYCHFHRQ